MPPLSTTDPTHSHKETDQPFDSKDSDKKLEGFEFLRAIFSLVIVALKSNLFLMAEVLLSSTFAYFLMATVGYLAVPVFVQMSLFLFYLKSGKKGVPYFLQKRLPRLISLYLFWVSLKIVLDVVYGDFHIQDAISSAKALVEFIVSGDTSPFFFFFSLIFLSTLAAVLSSSFKLIKSNFQVMAVKYILLVISCAFVFKLSMLEVVVTHITGQPAPELVNSIANLISWDYNPIGFLPYLLTTAIIAQEVEEKKLEQWSLSLKLKACGLISLAVLFSILEWNFFEKMLHYSRLSLVFSSWLLLYWAVLSPRKAPTSIRFLAACSLGIYGFHVFFTQHFSLNRISTLENFFQSMPLLGALATFLVAVIGSICLTLVFKKIGWLKNFV